MFRSLTLRAFGTSEPLTDGTNVVEKEDDPVVQELIKWNAELEELLQKSKTEVLSLSQQLITLTGKQILLQDYRTQTEDRFLALQQHYAAIQQEVEQLRKESTLLQLKLEFLQRQNQQQKMSPTLPMTTSL